MVHLLVTSNISSLPPSLPLSVLRTQTHTYKLTSSVGCWVDSTVPLLLLLLMLHFLYFDLSMSCAEFSSTVCTRTAVLKQMPSSVAIVCSANATLQSGNKEISGKQAAFTANCTHTLSRPHESSSSWL